MSTSSALQFSCVCFSGRATNCGRRTSTSSAMQSSRVCFSGRATNCGGRMSTSSAMQSSCVCFSGRRKSPSSATQFSWDCYSKRPTISGSGRSRWAPVDSSTEKKFEDETTAKGQTKLAWTGSNRKRLTNWRQWRISDFYATVLELYSYFHTSRYSAKCV